MHPQPAEQAGAMMVQLQSEISSPAHAAAEGTMGQQQSWSVVPADAGSVEVVLGGIYAHLWESKRLTAQPICKLNGCEVFRSLVSAT
jgi:hypothetical protein